MKATAMARSLWLLVPIIVDGFVGVPRAGRRIAPRRAAEPRPRWLEHGSEVTAVVVSFGPLGASVTVTPRDAAAAPRAPDATALDDEALLRALDRGEADGARVRRGLILQEEIAYFRAARGGEDVVRGERLAAFANSVRPDGKVDVHLRPPGRDKVTTTARDIMRSLERARGELPIGDKSTPAEIDRFFPGVSKKVFKDAVGALYRERKVVPKPGSIRLMTESERADAPPVPPSREGKPRTSQRRTRPSTRPEAP